MPPVRSKRLERFRADGVVGGGVWLAFAICCALPLGWMVVALCTTPAAASALHPIAFHLRLLGRTLVYNVGVAVVATLLALPVAIVLGKGRGIVAGILSFLLPAALLLPSIVYAYGWMQVVRAANEFAQAHGWLQGLGIGSVYPVPGTRGDVFRCVWTLATWLWPIPAGIIGLSLRRMDGDLQQQALLDGGYWRVVGRELVGPAVAGMAIVAILAMQEFAVYEPTGISVVATEVRTVFETGEPGWTTGAISSVKTGTAFSLSPGDQERNAAAALVTAMPMLLVIAILSAIVLFWGRGDEASESIDVGAKPRVLAAGWGSILLAIGVIGIALVLPIVSMIGSIHRGFDLSRIWRTFSPPVSGTLSVATATGAIAVLLAAGGLVRRFTGPVVLGLVTFLIGGQLLAIALIRLYNHPQLALDRWVYNGPVIVVMAYLARFGWLAMIASRSTWLSRWRGVRDMAAIDGAGAVAAARYVVWPLAWPMVAACGVLVMLLSMTEVPATILLNPLRPQVFVPQLMAWVHTLRSDDMLEGSLLLAGMVILLASVVVGLSFVARRRSVVMARRVVVLSVALLIAGCSRSDKPDEVWLETGAGQGQVVYPRGLCYSKADDTFYVVDRLARIQHLDHAGHFIAGWRMPEFAQGKPVGLTIGPDGNLWVPDTHYSRVMVFTPDGKLLKQFGKYGREKGEFIYTSDVAFDAKGRIFVSEFGDHDRIQVFDKELHYLFEFGRFGDGDGEFSRPQSMVIDGETLYVTDACNHRIDVFTTDGRFVRSMGRIGSGLGEFRFPYGLDMDAKGRLVVCEFGNNRVQLIDKETGKGLATWGSGGREIGQLAYPWGVAVDKNNRVVAVDAGNNRLQVFAF
jgi:ABC-type Fe3+ transport system permease subunit/sugar lactone lactonase YvrE